MGCVLVSWAVGLLWTVGLGVRFRWVVGGVWHVVGCVRCNVLVARWVVVVLLLLCGGVVWLVLLRLMCARGGLSFARWPRSVGPVACHARSGEDRAPPPAAKPSQEWLGVAHRNLRQEWRGTNHTTHQPQPHQHTTAARHIPRATADSETMPGVAWNGAQDPPPGVARTAHHHRQRNSARSGGE